MSLTVSHLGAEAGLSAATVRYYERLGLLPAPERTAAGYRQYQQDEIERLRFIKNAQRIGLRLREIGKLQAICDQGLCPFGHSEALLRGRMAEIDARSAELQAVRAELARVVERYLVRACHDPTATSRWCETAFAEERRGAPWLAPAAAALARSAHPRAPIRVDVSGPMMASANPYHSEQQLLCSRDVLAVP
jgi:DNA-binding transcriptional MerR regulator